MKDWKKIMIAAGAVAVLTAATPALAETGPSIAYGIVDMGQVLQQSEAAKGILAEMEKKRKEYQDQIEKEETKLRVDEEAIIKQRDTVTKDEFEKKRKAFEEKVMNAQKLVQGRKHTLDQAFGESMAKLKTESAKIVSDIAKEKGYAAVFTQEAVIIATRDMDITEEVVKRLNKDVKKIAVDWSQKPKDKK